MIRSVLGAALALALAAPAFAQTIAITGGTVAIGDGSAPIENGTVVIANGRVVAAGAGVAVPAGAKVIDAAGKWVAPGMVAGFSRIGLLEVDGVDPTNDVAANGSTYAAAIDVVPAINPRASAIAVSRAEGITRAVVAPAVAQSIFAGQGALIDLGADMSPITKPKLFQFVELGEKGASEAGGSRAAAHVAFRNALSEARDFATRGTRSDDAVLSRPDVAALVPVVNGQIPLLVHVERASDILEALSLTRSFPGLKLILVGVSEGWMVAPQIAAAKVPVLATALADLPASFEILAATQSNIGRLKAAGVTVGIGMIDDDEARQARLIKQYAGNLVALTRVPGASGLDWGAAFATITSKPAEVFGLAGEIGSLRPGRRADVVIWDGDPLELASAPVAVMIDGVEQPTETRQTRLRDRYRTVTEGALPKAYDR